MGVTIIVGGGQEMGSSCARFVSIFKEPVLVRNWEAKYVDYSTWSVSII